MNETAWRELHDKLSWMQGNKALPVRYLGMNFADIANDLIDRAYPGLREGHIDTSSPLYLSSHYTTESKPDAR